MTEQISIIGGAIAGPAAAFKLAQAGYQVTVYEQNQPSDLVSAGVLGIDPHVWGILRASGLDPDRYTVPNEYHIFGTKHSFKSHYYYVPWRKYHKMLADAGMDAGVRYVFGKRVTPSELPGQVIDATGIAGAARDHLPFEYTGRVVFRGESGYTVGGEFTVYQDKIVASTYSDVDGRCAWTLYCTRPLPEHLRTVPASIPPEVDAMPPKLRRIIRNTTKVVATPTSHWKERNGMRHDNGIITIGDVNGPIEAVTTSGASLATLEGFEVPTLMQGGPMADERERECLDRRNYVLALGKTLARPEIGGEHEDPHFVMHENMIYGGL